MNQNNIIRAAAYARFSSDNQREESIDAQLRAIRDYAQRYNIVIVAEYIDRAKSATTDNRPQFLKMVEDAALDKFDVIIVHKLDRFSRNRFDSAIYRRKLARAGVTLRSVLENLDDSPESAVLESVLEGMAEYYSRNLAREVEKGLHENAFHCLHTGGVPPLGYDVDPASKHLVLNPEEAETVRLIFQRTLEGFSYGEIMEECNRLGRKTKRGGDFTKNSLYSILHNEKYTGTFIYNRSQAKDVDGKRNGHREKPREEWIIIEDAFPAIISKEDFALIQKKLKARRQTRRHSHAKENYLLTGKMECGVCGGSYVGARRRRSKDGSIWAAYDCNRRLRTGKKQCSNREIGKDMLEKYVLGRLAEYVFHDKYIAAITREYNLYCKEQLGNAPARQKELGNRLKKVEKDIERVTDLLLQTSSDALLNRLNALETEKVRLKNDTEELERQSKVYEVTEQEVADTFQKIRQSLLDGEINGMKRMLDAIVQKIIVYPDRVTVMFNFFPKLTLWFEKDDNTLDEPKTGAKKEGCD